MPTLTKDSTVWTLDLGSDENRFHPEWLEQTDALLDEIADSTEPAVLVTAGSGKFFSNGLDLEWLGANGDRLGWYVDRIHALFAKVLTLPVPTVAAVNGHAFGGGAMLAMAHDFRVMREDRGFFCFPRSTSTSRSPPGCPP
ncbi:enoyl-CoA hydratase-related protein [Nocardioides houyundeii]|uniref:enoyl-CoA hydratase-related protein n=1 Tax=Nocardioides houyundeii TaxID=2045452 RepID=UPI0024119564|nr:enoyl-CoA hydratase-related protein [Nocardioides houyundeii]